MNWTGLIAAIGTFLLIGRFSCDRQSMTEYYFGKQVWPVFAGVGIFSLLASLLISNMIISVLIAVFGITCIWSIKELFEQEEAGKERMISGKSEEKAEIRKIRTERRCYIKSHVPAYFQMGT